MKKITAFIVFVWLNQLVFGQTKIDHPKGDTFILKGTDQTLIIPGEMVAHHIGSEPLATDSEEENTFPGNISVSLMANPGLSDKINKSPPAIKTTTAQQSVIAPQGWSGISSFVIPDDPTIENIFQSIQDQLILLGNEEGIYCPAQFVNSLINWNPQSGYIARFDQETNIEFSGQVIQNGMLNLNAGWNLMPILSTCPVNTEAFFGDYPVTIVKEVAGWKLFWPEMGINTLDTLLPGKACFVLMQNPANINFPACSTQTWQCGDALTDTRNNHEYATVMIGNQCWMQQNLNIGTMIYNTAYPTNNGVIEKWCYNVDESNCDLYGGQYYWDEMMGWTNISGTKGICPDGWHIPTNDEWTALTDLVGGYTLAGGNLKSTGTIEAGTGLWLAPNTGATNSVGFTAIPGGQRNVGGSSQFLGAYASFWASTEYSASRAWGRRMFNTTQMLDVSNYTKLPGYSVRCVKN